MRFLFRSLVLMIVGSIVMSCFWHSRSLREGGLSRSLPSVTSDAGGKLRSMLPDTLPYFPDSPTTRVHAGSRGEEIYFSPTSTSSMSP